MKRKSIVAIALGVAACATAASGPLEHGTSVEIEAGEGDLGSIAGVVRDGETGEPVRPEKTIIVVQCSCLPEDRHTNTQAGGIFGLRDLPAGTYTVHILGPGDEQATQVVELAPGARVRLRVTLEDQSMLLT